MTPRLTSRRSVVSAETQSLSEISVAPRLCCATKMWTASEARELDVYRDCTNRLFYHTVPPRPHFLAMNVTSGSPSKSASWVQTVAPTDWAVA